MSDQRSSFRASCMCCVAVPGIDKLTLLCKAGQGCPRIYGYVPRPLVAEVYALAVVIGHPHLHVGLLSVCSRPHGSPARRDSYSFEKTACPRTQQHEHCGFGT